RSPRGPRPAGRPAPLDGRAGAGSRAARREQPASPRRRRPGADRPRRVHRRPRRPTRDHRPRLGLAGPHHDSRCPMSITMHESMRPVLDALDVPTDLLVAGTWRGGADGGRIDVRDPASGAVLASVADARIPDAEAAVDAAAEAAAGWAATAPRARAELLLRAFTLMHERSEELAL